jgi:hypothetical protein
VLAGIFGKTAAVSIVSKIKVKQKPTAAAAAGSSAAAASAASSLKAPKKKQLVETKKFAGKEIT